MFVLKLKSVHEEKTEEKKEDKTKHCMYYQMLLLDARSLHRAKMKRNYKVQG